MELLNVQKVRSRLRLISLVSSGGLGFALPQTLVLGTTGNQAAWVMAIAALLFLVVHIVLYRVTQALIKVPQLLIESDEESIHLVAVLPQMTVKFSANLGREGPVEPAPPLIH
jgi:type IV secretory pathway VirB3-like protein